MELRARDQNHSALTYGLVEEADQQPRTGCGRGTGRIGSRTSRTEAAGGSQSGCEG